MNFSNVYPYILARFFRESTDSSVWMVVPPDFTSEFLREGDWSKMIGKCALHFASDLPGFEIERWIMVNSPEEAKAIVEQGYWPA